MIILLCGSSLVPLKYKLLDTIFEHKTKASGIPLAFLIESI